MAKTAEEKKVLKKALEHRGLMTENDWLFVNSINTWPDSWTMRPAQSKYLFDIGEYKLDMIVNREDTGANMQPVANHYRKGVCA